MTIEYIIRGNSIDDDAYQTDLGKVIDDLSLKLRSKPESLEFLVSVNNYYTNYAISSIRRSVKGRSVYRWACEYRTNTVRVTLTRKKKIHQKFKRQAKLRTLFFEVPSCITYVEPFIYADKKLHNPDANVKVFGILKWTEGAGHNHIPKVEFDLINRKIINITSGQCKELEFVNNDQVLDTIGDLIVKAKGK